MPTRRVRKTKKDPLETLIEKFPEDTRVIVTGGSFTGETGTVEGHNITDAGEEELVVSWDRRRDDDGNLIPGLHPVSELEIAGKKDSTPTKSLKRRGLLKGEKSKKSSSKKSPPKEVDQEENPRKKMEQTIPHWEEKFPTETFVRKSGSKNKVGIVLSKPRVEEWKSKGSKNLHVVVDVLWKELEKAPPPAGRIAHVTSEAVGGLTPVSSNQGWGWKEQIFIAQTLEPDMEIYPEEGLRDLDDEALQWWFNRAYNDAADNEAAIQVDWDQIAEDLSLEMPFDHEPKDDEELGIQDEEEEPTSDTSEEEPVDEDPPVEDEDPQTLDELKIEPQEILGLTDNMEAAKLIGIPVSFNLDKFLKLLKELPALVALPTSHDSRLLASKIQESITEISKTSAFLNWAHNQAKDRFESWFAGEVQRQMKVAKAWYKEAYAKHTKGMCNKPKKPELSYIREQVRATRLYRVYRTAINSYEYWMDIIDKIGVKGMERKSMLLMSLNKNALGRAESNVGSLKQQIGDDLSNVSEIDDDDETLDLSQEKPEEVKEKPKSDPPKEETNLPDVDPGVLELFPWMREHPNLLAGVCDDCETKVVDVNGDGEDVRTYAGKPHECEDPINEVDEKDDLDLDTDELDLEDDKQEETKSVDSGSEEESFSSAFDFDDDLESEFDLGD